jgi:hypothetical protein
MAGMTAAPNPIRFAWAVLFALMLSLRVLASTGLMPVVDHGRLTIINCPDAVETAPLALSGRDLHHHHHGQADHRHDPCPYAAASWLSFVGNDYVLLSAIAIPIFACFAAPIALVPVVKRRQLRPPAIGPPFPA